jgi:hypothetical protein
MKKRGEDHALKDVNFMLREEENILSLLKKPVEKDLMDASKYNEAKLIIKEQSELRSRTKNTRNGLEELFRKSAAIKPETFKNLYSAETEMEKTGAFLSDKKTPDALESGYKTLEYLQAGRNAMKESSENLALQGENSGRPKGSSIQMKSGGIYGISNAPVELPDIKEYKPPREFRQELMEALKEKYPEEYEKIIKEYYKKLTE